MARLLERLCELAGNREDLVLSLADDIDCLGFLLFKEGKYHLYLNENIRDFRKSMALVQLLGDYAQRRFQARRDRRAAPPASADEGILREREREAWSARFSKRLLWRVRLGLHGPPSRRPRSGGLGGVS